MDAELVERIGLVVGFLICSVVAIQALVYLQSSIRRSSHEKKQNDLELSLFRERVELARLRRVEIANFGPGWNGYRKFEVSKKVVESPDGLICTFYLTPHDKRPLPAFMPGQYLTFQLNVPLQPKPIIRCYSLSDAPHPDHYRVTIKKVLPPTGSPDAPPGVSSSFFIDNVSEGDILDVKAPAGHFHIDTTRESPVVLIGGGIGITPVLSMLNYLIRSESKREAWVFLGVRNQTEHIMKSHLERVARTNEQVHLHVCYSRPDNEDTQSSDYLHAERVSVDLFKRILPSNNFDFYMCGPGTMMESLTRGLGNWGVPAECIHYEAFGPSSIKMVRSKPAGITESVALLDTPTVTFAKSRKSIPWDPECDSLLDLAESNGIELEFGCRAGNCGSCLVAVKSGQVEYPADYGAKPETGSCLMCIGIPTGPLELDA